MPLNAVDHKASCSGENKYAMSFTMANDDKNWKNFAEKG